MRTSSPHTTRGLVEEADWVDWNQATYQPLDDPALAERFVDRLLEVGDGEMSSEEGKHALARLQLEQGVTPKGVRILRAHLPFGQGGAEYEWDGSRVAAEEIIDSMAVTAARNVEWDATTWNSRQERLLDLSRPEESF